MVEFLVLLGIVCIIGACFGLRAKWNKNHPPQIEEMKEEKKAE